MPGRVEQIYVTEGDVVKKGQALVRVDPTQLSSQVSAYEAGVVDRQVELPKMADEIVKWARG